MYRFCFCFDKFWQRPEPPFNTIELCSSKGWWTWTNLEETKMQHEKRLETRKANKLQQKQQQQENEETQGSPKEENQ